MDLPPAHFVKDEMQNRRLIVNGLSKHNMGALGWLILDLGKIMLAQWALAKTPGTHEAYIKIFK